MHDNHPSGKGTLQFSSAPSGAQVYLDNQFQGTTPCTTAGIDPGNHTLEYRYSGYEIWHSTITVPSGPSTFYAALTPASSQAAVTRRGGDYPGPLPLPCYGSSG